jgi:hypothetical protein
MIGERRGLPRGRGSLLCARLSFGRASGRCRRAVRRAVVVLIAVTVMRGRRRGRCLRRRRAVGARRGLGQAGEAGEDHAAPHHRRHERAPHQGSHKVHFPRSSRRHSTIRHLPFGLVSAESPLRGSPRGWSGGGETSTWPGSGTEVLSMLSGSARSSMDRASDYGSEGWGFDSLRAR